jgi:hypothetical protein
MDWNAAIEKNCEALGRVLAMLVSMAGLRGQSTFFPQKGAAASGQVLAEKSELAPAPTLPRHLHRAVLRLLRPAEAAARRLGIVVALPPARLYKPKPAAILRNGVGTGIVMPRNVPHPEVRGEAEPRRRLCLPLLDPLPRWGGSKRPAAGGVPRICLPGLTEPFPVPGAPSPDDPIDATRLNLRLQALGRVLDNLPREARRFARWRVARDAAGTQNKKLRDAAGAQNGKRPDAAGGQDRNQVAGLFRRIWPLRPGRPPGGRRRPQHEVHDILNVVHGLAFWVLERPDTS